MSRPRAADEFDQDAFNIVFPINSDDVEYTLLDLCSNCLLYILVKARSDIPNSSFPAFPLDL
jgi:hypothetical protein